MSKNNNKNEKYLILQYHQEAHENNLCKKNLSNLI